MKSLKKKIPLTITSQLQKEIFYLCSNVDSDREWSGTLFYTVEGDLGEDNFSIQAEKLFLQDIGTKTYTEYDPGNPDFIKFLMDNPEMMKFKQGHIHSHNTMTVFFSGTDTSEIAENSECHNYYLSLIVNNRNEMVAKLAFRATEKKETKRTISFRGSDGKFRDNKVVDNSEEITVYAHDCDIFVEDTVGESFESRFLEVQTKVEKRDKDAKEMAKKAIEISRSVQGGETTGTGSRVGKGQYALFGHDGKATRKEKRAKKEKYFGHDEDLALKSPWDDDSIALRESFDWDALEAGPHVVKGLLPPTPARTVDFMIKWFARDYLYEGSLMSVLKVLNKNMYPDKNKPSEDDCNLYYDALIDAVDDYYISFFPEDAYLANFNKTLEKAMDILATYEEQFPELINNLNECLEISLDEVD